MMNIFLIIIILCLLVTEVIRDKIFLKKFLKITDQINKREKDKQLVYDKINSMQNGLTENINSLKNDVNQQISSLNDKISAVSSLSYWNMVSSAGEDIKKINKDDLAEQTNSLIEQLEKNIKKTEKLKKDLFGGI